MLGPIWCLAIAYAADLRLDLWPTARPLPAPGTAARPLARSAYALPESLIGRARDATAEFRQAWNKPLPRLALELAPYKILLVPGLNYEFTPGYFQDQLDYFERAGMDAELVALRSGRSSEDNGRQIAAAIAASAKPVLILTHSKGSIDTLVGLLTDEAARRKAAAWAPVQAPFHGSPVADAVLTNPFLRLTAAGLIALKGGTLAGLMSLSSAQRRRFFQDHEKALRRLARKLPIVAVTSWIEPGEGAGNPAYWSLQMGLMGIRSDGLVPLESGLLPSADYVVLKGVDHYQPIFAQRHGILEATPGKEIRPYDRVRFTQALLTMLARRVRRT